MTDLLTGSAIEWAAWMDGVWLRHLFLLGGGVLLLLALRRFDPRLRRTIAVMIVAVLFLPPLFTLEQELRPFDSAVSSLTGSLPMPEMLSHMSLAPNEELTYAPASASIEFSPLNILFLVWLAVAFSVAALFIRSTFPYYRLALKVGAANCSTTDDGIRTIVHPMADGAFVVAWFSGARIVLPAAWSELQPDVRAAILAHEQAHVKQKDHLWTLLFAAVCVVFWWNPLVWLLFREYRITAEMCSDDRARKSANIPATAYAQLLLDLVRPSAPRLATAVRLAHSEAGIKQRILHQISPSNELNMRKTLFTVVCLAFVPYLLQSEAPAADNTPVEKAALVQSGGNMLAAATENNELNDADGMQKGAPKAWVDGGFQALADRIVFPWDQVVAKNEASIQVEVQVDAEGRINAVEFLRGQSQIVRGMGNADDLQVFADAVIQAVKTTVFHPAELEDGSKVQSTLVLPFIFRYRKVGSAGDVFSDYLPIVNFAPIGC